MLILARYEGEVITIGDDIEITVLGSPRGGRVELGIQALRDIVVLRKELAEKQQQQTAKPEK